MRLRALLIAALPFTCAAPALAAPAAVGTSEAWCRATPPAAPTAACYLTLTAAADDRLVAVETPAARTAEIHTMSMDGGVMRMRRLAAGLALPAGKAVALEAGGEHLMLIGPKARLTAGGSVRLTLKFAKAAPVTLTARVRAAAPAMGGH